MRPKRPSRSARHKLRVVLGVTFGVFLALQAYDVLSTYIALTQAVAGMNNISESNLIAVWLIDRIGLIPAMLLLKGVSIGIILAALIIVDRCTPNSILDDESALIALLFVTAFGVFVLSNNFNVLRFMYS